MNMNLLGGFHAAKKILWLLFLYNLGSVVAFSMLYHTVGLDKHFELPEGTPATYPNCLYYAFAVQATCMAGEIYPKTPLGRGILSCQILSAFLSTMVLIVPWIRATSSASK